MSKTIKLTAKRQATFPAELCRDLDLAPGDEIQLGTQTGRRKALLAPSEKGSVYENLDWDTETIC